MKIVTQYYLVFVYSFLMFFFYYKPLGFDASIFPREIDNLIGILTMPFVHADLQHLFNNLPTIALGLFILITIYPKNYLKILFFGQILTGAFIWIMARKAHHIGASGVGFMLIFFIFVSSIISQNKEYRVAALALLSIQSGLIISMLPQNTQISWDGHLLGTIVGIILAFYFQELNPPKNTKSLWKISNENFEDDEYKKFGN